MKTIFEGKKLYAVIIAFLLMITFFITFYIIRNHYQHVFKNVITENTLTANLLSSLLYEHQKAAISILGSYAQRLSFIDAVKKKDFHRALYHLKSLSEHHTEIDVLFITDQYGTLWANYPVDRKGFGKNLAYRDWYKGVSKKWRPYISTLYQRVVLEKGLAVALSVPVLDRKGKIVGILSVAQRTSFLATLIKTNTLDPGQIITLLDQEGNIIFSNAIPYQEKITKYPDAHVLEKALAGVVIDMETADAKEKGGLSYVSIAPVKGIGWSVIVGQEKNAILKSLYGYFILSAVTGFVIFLFLTVSLLYFRREYRYRKTKELLQAEEKYRNIFNDAILGIYQTTPEGRFLSANPALARMYGYDTPEELINSITDLATQSYVNPEDREIFKRILLREGVVEKFETPLRKKGGETIWVSINAHTVKDTQGNISCYEGTIENITERKRAEEALKKSAQLLRDTGEMAKVGGWELDLSTKVVSWTEEVGRIHGVEPGYKPKLEEALNFYAPESRPALEEALKKAAETGEPYDLESLFIPSGSKDKIWIRSLGKAVYSGGKIVKLTGTFQNIDKYKRTEEALRESEERYKRLVEGSPDIIWSFSDKRGTIYASARVQDILGYSPDYLYKKPWLWNESIHPDDRSLVSQAITDFAAGRDLDVEYRIKNTAGDWLWFHDRSIGRWVEGSEVIIEGISINITSRKQAEEEKRRLEERSRKVVEDIFRFIPEGVLVFSRKMELLRQNQTFRELVSGYAKRLGFAEDELENLIVDKIKAAMEDENIKEIKITRKRETGEQT